MSHQTDRNGIELSMDTAEEQRLWHQLGQWSDPVPSDQMRHRFHQMLGERLDRPASLAQRIRAWWHSAGSIQWMATAASLAIGVLLGTQMAGSSDPASARSTTSLAEHAEVEQLSQDVAELREMLALTLMERDQAPDRLQGVRKAALMLRTAGPSAGEQQDVTRALLRRAVADDSDRVRVAAVDALGPALSSSDVASELFTLMAQTESPMLQRNLADLVMRWGTDEHLEELLLLARSEQLKPMVRDYILGHVQTTSL